MTFSWWTFLFEVLNFVVLAYVLHRLLYAPLRAGIEQRQREAGRAREEAEKARQAAAELQHSLEERAAELERDREAVLRQAREQAEAERRRLLDEAEQARKRRQEEARQALDQERDEALRALRKEVVGLAVDVAGRLLREATDSSLHRQLVLRLAEALAALPEAERDRLRRGWQPDDGAVLEAAADVDGPTLDRVRESVAAALGRPAALEVRGEPSLLGGARLRLGGWVWDATLSGQLDGARQERPQEEGSCPTSSGG
jgi:F-type H+-transporting ATPase subunit b